MPRFRPGGGPPGETSEPTPAHGPYHTGEGIMSDSQTDDVRRTGLRRFATWKTALGLSGLAVVGAGAVLAVGTGGEGSSAEPRFWAASASPAESPSAAATADAPSIAMADS